MSKLPVHLQQYISNMNEGIYKNLPSSSKRFAARLKDDKASIARPQFDEKGNLILTKKAAKNVDKISPKSRKIGREKYDPKKHKASRYNEESQLDEYDDINETTDWKHSLGKRRDYRSPKQAKKDHEASAKANYDSLKKDYPEVAKKISDVRKRAIERVAKWNKEYPVKEEHLDEGKYRVKKTSSHTTYGDPEYYEPDVTSRKYDVYKGKAKVGSLRDNDYFGGLHGKIHNKDLPYDISRYGSKTAKTHADTLAAFVQSKTGKKWRSNIWRYSPARKGKKYGLKDSGIKNEEHLDEGKTYKDMPAKRNKYAKELEDRKYSQRVLKDKTKYTRKQKHKKVDESVLGVAAAAIGGAWTGYNLGTGAMQNPAMKKGARSAGSDHPWARQASAVGDIVKNPTNTANYVNLAKAYVGMGSKQTKSNAAGKKAMANVSQNAKQVKKDLIGEEQLDEISKKKFKVAKKAFPNLLKNVRHKDMGCKEKNLDERKFDSREKIKGEPSFLGVPTTYIKGGSKKTFADTVLVSPKGYKGGGKVKRIPKSQYDPKKHNLAEEQLDEGPIKSVKKWIQRSGKTQKQAAKAKAEDKKELAIGLYMAQNRAIREPEHTKLGKEAWKTQRYYMRYKKFAKEETLDEKAVSKSQQKLFGMALAMRRGESDRGSEKVASLAADLSQKKLRDFAKTKHKGLPGHVKKGKKK